MNANSTGEYTDFNYSLKTLVIGLGISGYASVEFLAQKNCDFDVCDTRINPPNAEKLLSEFPEHQLICAELSGELLNNYEQLVVSPGISIRQQVFIDFKNKGGLIFGDVALFAQELQQRIILDSSKAKVVAITGSNGKSTVTTMVEHIANRAGIKALAGGNLGLPVLAMLRQDVDLFVLELSSFQLETLDNLVTESAVVLNVSEDHMDRYEDIFDYQRVKEKIYRQAKLKVLNLDEPFARILNSKFNNSAERRYNSICFSLGIPQQGQYGLRAENSDEFLAFENNNILSVDQLKIKGKHNYANALAAMALLQPWHLTTEVLSSALKSYAGLPHRCQWVRKLNRVNFYNDSKGTNVGASIAAINGFSEPIILIAGGVGKGADFSDLAKVAQEKIAAVVLFGQDAELIAQAITACPKGQKNKVQIKRVENMQEAVVNAYEMASPGMSILFSPACASFDQYENYVRRGEDFVQQVKVLG